MSDHQPSLPTEPTTRPASRCATNALPRRHPGQTDITAFTRAALGPVTRPHPCRPGPPRHGPDQNTPSTAETQPAADPACHPSAAQPEQAAT